MRKLSDHQIEKLAKSTLLPDEPGNSLGQRLTFGPDLARTKFFVDKRKGEKHVRAGYIAAKNRAELYADSTLEAPANLGYFNTYRHLAAEEGYPIETW